MIEFVYCTWLKDVRARGFSQQAAVVRAAEGDVRVQSTNSVLLLNGVEKLREKEKREHNSIHTATWRTEARFLAGIFPLQRFLFLVAPHFSRMCADDGLN